MVWCSYVFKLAIVAEVTIGKKIASYIAASVFTTLIISNRFLWNAINRWGEKEVDEE